MGLLYLGHHDHHVEIFIIHTVAILEILFKSYGFQENLISAPCLAGTYRSLVMESCEVCVGNTISTKGADSCTSCIAGYLANSNKTICGMLHFHTKTICGLLHFHTKTICGMLDFYPLSTIQTLQFYIQAYCHPSNQGRRAVPTLR